MKKLLIGLTVVGLLAIIAVPTYGDYVKRSEQKQAEIVASAKAAVEAENTVKPVKTVKPKRSLTLSGFCQSNSSADIMVIGIFKGNMQGTLNVGKGDIAVNVSTSYDAPFTMTIPDSNLLRIGLYPVRGTMRGRAMLHTVKNNTWVNTDSYTCEFI